MNSNHRTLFAVLLACLACGVARSAEETDKPRDRKPADADRRAVVIPDAASPPVMITNTVSIQGTAFTYVAETGMLPLLETDGEPRASVFYVAYTAAERKGRDDHPVMFCFNGGPGSSSVWLHLGALGPRRVVLNADGSMPPPPFRLTDNTYSILDATDLVFIDPVATGYSRPEKDEKPEEFFGQSRDVESVGAFIRLWTARNERWLSPKYLCGESYGVFRAAGLAEHLHSRYGMYLNGLVLVSGVLDFATLREEPGNELAATLFLPAFTATAHYHGKLPPDLQEDLALALTEARAFANGDYPLALRRGQALDGDARSETARRLARFTGLAESLILDHDLQISSPVFREHLLREEGLILGRFDARITGHDADRSRPTPGFDPSYASAYGPFSAAMNAYVRGELRFTNDLPYEILAGVKPWTYDARNTYPSVTRQLASVMNQNPYLRLLVMGGLRDLATPIDGMRYTLDHLAIDTAMRSNIVWAEYESGHMMYVNAPDLAKMHADLERFLRP